MRCLENAGSIVRDDLDIPAHLPPEYVEGKEKQQQVAPFFAFKSESSPKIRRDANEGNEAIPVLITQRAGVILVPASPATSIDPVWALGGGGVQKRAQEPFDI